MPSFDVVCKTNTESVRNAVAGAMKEINSRYDFKGLNCTIELSDKLDEITMIAEDDYKLKEMNSMLAVHLTRHKVDAKAIEIKETEKASLGKLRQKSTIKQGIDKELAKKLVKEVKQLKLKVQVSIRGEELRVEGKKIDDLRTVMDFLKGMDLDTPVVFENMRS